MDDGNLHERFVVRDIVEVHSCGKLDGTHGQITGRASVGMGFSVYIVTVEKPLTIEGCHGWTTFVVPGQCLFLLERPGGM